MVELKTFPTGASVDDFLAAVPAPGRRSDALILKSMMDKASGVPAVMWGPSIVGYGTFHYRYATGHEGDMPVISFSPRKASMSVYGVHYPGLDNSLESIGPHKTGAWCLYLGSFAKLNLDALEEAISRAWNGGIPVIADTFRS